MTFTTTPRESSVFHGQLREHKRKGTLTRNQIRKVQQEAKQFEVFDGERYLPDEGPVPTKKTFVMAKKTSKFADNRSQLVNVIKASQRLEGKPTYGLAERTRNR